METHMEARAEGKMVMVAVPEYLVTDVYRFIVKEEERRANSANGEQDGTQLQQAEAWRYSHDWSEDDLRDVLENGTRAMKIILPFLAERADKNVKAQVLAEAVYGKGAKSQQLGGALGSFTKTAYKQFGRRKWPFKAIRNDEDRSWEYRMYSGTAEKVKRLMSISRKGRQR
jgi:hypothetical protein